MQAIKIARPVEELIRPPSFKVRNHMLTQNPPSKQPRPSVMSVNTSERAPNIKPEMNAATKNAPCIALVTGGLIK